MALFDDFETPSRWEIVTDGVMGGASTARMAAGREDGSAHVALRGRVSTARGGGFVMLRRQVDGLPPDVTGIMLDVRGNGGRYEVHLTTSHGTRPWHHYAASFTAPRGWTQIDMPLSAFTAQGWGMTAPLWPPEVTSVAVVAIGRDHDAAVDVRRIILR